MNVRYPISADTLRLLLRYEAATGKLFWKPRTLDLCISAKAMNVFNTQFAGKEAFTADNGDGYLCGHMRGKTMKAHRVIWAIVHGVWPKDQIDHINGNRRDNRIDNLRETSNAQNQWNRKPKRGCKSRYKGVSYIRKSGKWQARIVVNGQRKSLGHFGSEQDARKAYAAASLKYHGEYGRVG